MDNKFQWGRLDEVFVLIIGFAFLIILAHLNMPAEAIMTMGGTLVTVVPIYVKAALERRNGNDNGNGNGNGKKPPVAPDVPERIFYPIATEVAATHESTPTVEEKKEHFLRE